MQTVNMNMYGGPRQGQRAKDEWFINGWRTRSFAWLIAAALTGIGAFVLLSNLRGCAPKHRNQTGITVSVMRPIASLPAFPKVFGEPLQNE